MIHKIIVTIFIITMIEIAKLKTKNSNNKAIKITKTKINFCHKTQISPFTFLNTNKHKTLIKQYTIKFWSPLDIF